MSSPYLDRNYNTKKRFCSYWHQVDELLESGPGTVLEVGKGSGFLSDYLKRGGVDIKTLDIDPDVKLDHIGSVLELPFDDQSFDYSCCFEVLEHLPFDDVARALGELWRVTRKRVILSVPDKSKVYYADWKLPLLGRLHIIFQGLRFFLAPQPKLSKVHEWEIGLKGFPPKRIRSLIEDNGFRIEKEYRVFENPRHRFYVLIPNPTGESSRADADT